VSKRPDLRPAALRAFQISRVVRAATDATSGAITALLAPAWTRDRRMGGLHRGVVVVVEAALRAA